MKNIIIFTLFSLCSILSFSQSWVDDIDFNRPKNACYINDVFVKNFIGFDTGRNSGFTNLSKKSLEEPIKVNGIEYGGITVASCEKEIHFTTFKDIQKTNYPDITGPVIFMIDNYFIMNDIDSYKLDADYIAKCELLSSSNFDDFKDKKTFSIIRVFTKRDQSSRLR